MDTYGGKSNRRTSSRQQAAVWLVALSAASLPLGCGDDDDSGGATGGAAGKGGAGATAGNAGNASAGKASGGSPSGGSPGTAGKAGNGGVSSGGANSGGTSSGGASSGGGGANASGGTPAGGVPGGAGEGGAGGDAGGQGGAGGEPVGGMGPGGAGTAGNGGAGGAECGAGFEQLEWEAIQLLTPLPAVPADTTNAFADNAAAATLGQKFFFEKGFSGPLADLGNGVVNDLGNATETGKVACASCHSSAMMSDGRSPMADGSRPANVSLGANFHTRNAPAMVNSSFYTWTNWGGRFVAQWELPMPVTESPVIMNSTRLRVAHVIFDKYKTEYEAVFGALESAIGSDAARFPAAGKPKATGAADGPWEGMTDPDRAIVNRIFVNYGKALAAYNRKLVSRNAPLDRFVACDQTALSESAKNGLKLFVGQAGCVTCHGGSHLSDGLFHNIGVAQTGAHVPAADNGRFNDAPLGAPFSAGSTWSDDASAGTARRAGIPATMPDASRAAFRTPSLRGVAETAPYMHSGQLATLADVIEFYDRGGDTPSAGTKELQPLNLSVTQKADLVNFLKALTGDAVPPALLVDTSQ